MLRRTVPVWIGVGFILFFGGTSGKRIPSFAVIYFKSAKLFLAQDSLQLTFGLV